MIKVVHLIAGDLEQGAAKGVLILHETLNKINIDSTVITNGNYPDSSNKIVSVRTSFYNKTKDLIYRYLEFLLPKLFYHKMANGCISTGLFGHSLLKMKFIKDADIIHLHYVNKALLNIRDLKYFRKPIVWTLRDMWPITGGCHFANYNQCRKYENYCKKCPRLINSIGHDITTVIMKRKLQYYPAKLNIVAMSSFIEEKAKKSKLMKNMNIEFIPNNIDTGVFRPRNNYKYISKGNIPNKIIILIGALNLDNKHKGIDVIIECLNQLDVDKYHLVTFGRINKRTLNKLKIRHTGFDLIKNDDKLAEVYSAADLFISASKLESFGKTIAESMACGTPCLSVNAGGARSIITHKENGYLYSCNNIDDMIKGIEWILTNNVKLEVSQKARSKIVNKFSRNIIAKKYKNLYKRLMVDQT